MQELLTQWTEIEITNAYEIKVILKCQQNFRRSWAMELFCFEFMLLAKLVMRGFDNYYLILKQSYVICFELYFKTNQVNMTVLVFTTD